MNDRPARRRLLVAAAVLLVCGAAGLLAVRASRGGRNSPEASIGVVAPAPVSMPAMPDNPAEWGGKPMAGVGLSPLEHDPPEAFAPPDGVRASGFRKRTPEGYSDIVTFLSPRGVAELEGFYKNGLEQAGFRLLSRRQTMARDGVFMAFFMDGRRCTVSLRAAGGNRTRVVVVVDAAHGGGH